jgi:hypothetical protein
MRTSLILLSVMLFLPLTIAARDEGACDMKKVESGLYCETDDMLLDKDDIVSDKTYSACSECGAIVDDECECGGKVEKKTSGKNVCAQCFEKPVKVEVCVKEFYECEDCGERATTAGECPDCEVALVKQTSKAVITYECSECGAATFAAGKCTDEECENHGKALQKSCSESGSFPHVKPKS